MCSGTHQCHRSLCIDAVKHCAGLPRAIGNITRVVRGVIVATIHGRSIFTRAREAPLRVGDALRPGDLVTT